MKYLNKELTIIYQKPCSNIEVHCHQFCKIVTCTYPVGLKGCFLPFLE